MIRAVIHDADREVGAILSEILASDEEVSSVRVTENWTQLGVELRKRGISVVVLGPSFGRDDIDPVTDLIADYPNAVFVQVADEVDAGLLQSAMRHGIRDVVRVDEAEDELPGAVGRAHSFMRAESTSGVGGADGSSGGRVVATFGTKGGTGKTVVATNLAILAAREGVRTALVDANLSFGDCAAFLRVKPDRSISDLSTMTGDIDESVLESVMTPHESGLKILASSSDPLTAERIDASLLSRVLKGFRSTYDLTIVDTASALDVVTEAVLAEADLAFLVTSLDLPSIKQAKLCLATFDRLSLGTDKIRIVLNRANSNVGFPPDEVAKALGKKVAIRLPSDIAVPRSVNGGTVVSIEAPKARVSKALEKLSAGMLSELFPERKTERKPVAQSFFASRVRKGSASEPTKAPDKAAGSTPEIATGGPGV